MRYKLSQLISRQGYSTVIYIRHSAFIEFNKKHMYFLEEK